MDHAITVHDVLVYSVVSVGVSLVFIGALALLMWIAKGFTK